MKQFRWVYIAAVVVLVAVYVAIRFWSLTGTCLWFDEIFSVHAAEHSWDSILRFIALDLIHPPLFYVLLKVWTALGGESLAWLRTLPVVFSIISIIPFIFLLHELKFSATARLISLLILTVNGSLLKYSLEVRMYSLLLCLGLLSMWLFVRYCLKGKSFVPLLIVNILLVYTHYFGWFVIISEVVVVLVFFRIRLRSIIGMFTAVTVLFFPWAAAVWNGSATGSGPGQNIGWMSRPGIGSIAQLVLNLIEPFYYQSSSDQRISIFIVSVPVLIIVLTALAIYFSEWKMRDDDERQPIELLAIFIAVPLSIAFTVSWLLPYSIWGTRHLIVVFAPVSMLLGLAIARMSAPAVRLMAITLLVLFSGYGFLNEIVKEQKQYVWCAWNDVASRFGGIHATGKVDPIYAFEELTAYHLWFALRNNANSKVILVKGTGVPEDTAYFLPRGFTGVDVSSEADVTAYYIAIAFRDDGFDLTKPPLIGLLQNGYEVSEIIPFPAGSSHAFLVRMRKRS